MKFEEQFPSLKENQYADDSYESPCDLKTFRKFYPSYKEGDWLKIEDVKEHCLDKQRVKDAFELILGILVDAPPTLVTTTTMNECVIKRQMEILGLDK